MCSGSRGGGSGVVLNGQLGAGVRGDDLVAMVRRGSDGEG